MRLDPEHVRKINDAIVHTDNGSGPEVKFDVSFMRAAMSRLSLWEGGVLIQALIKAASSKRRTPEQRALLALFVHQEERVE